MTTTSTTPTSAVIPGEEQTIYIHLFNVVGKPSGSYPLTTLPVTRRTPACEFCPCVQPGEVAAFFERMGASLLKWARPLAPFERFVSGSFTFGPLPGLFFTSTRRRADGFLTGGGEARHIWMLLEREGNPWNPEPIFQDGDPHHA